ncbi:MAG: formate dehydrogenase subunit gamma, partial [Alphaproteobacteria bacterium HGW-Alphaproteobacteria-2]
MNLRLFIPALLLALAATVGGTGPAVTQEAPAIDRSATGGAPTLDDILARQNAQRGGTVDTQALGAASQSPTPLADLPPRGGSSNADIFRALRHNVADVTTVTSGPATDVLIQDAGMAWLQFRDGPLKTWGGYALLGMIGLLALFYLL